MAARVSPSAVGHKAEGQAPTSPFEVCKATRTVQEKMTDQPLTKPAYRAIMGGDIGLQRCSDGMLSWFFYDKTGRRRREVLGIEGDLVFQFGIAPWRGELDALLGPVLAQAGLPQKLGVFGFDQQIVQVRLWV